MNHELLHRIFEHHADVHPDEVAVRDEHGAIDYAGLNIFSNRIAHALLKTGLHPGDVAAVLLPPGIPWVASVLALFKTGILYLPMSRSYPEKKIAGICRHIRCRAVIVAAEWESWCRALCAQNGIDDMTLIVVHSGGEVRCGQIGDHDARFTIQVQMSFANPAGKVSINDACYIIYTSGSTGMGKAIVGCHKGLTHFIKWQVREFALNESCRAGQLASIIFDASFRDLFVPLTTGGTLCIPPEAARSNMAELLRWMEENAITLLHTVPAVFRLIIRQLEVEDRTPRLPKLKQVFLAGEPLYVKDVMNWRKAAGQHTELVNLYGTSETTMAKTFYRVGELPPDPATVLPAGKPIDHTVVAVINQDRICRVGELGEIYIKTPYWTKGYFKNDDANRKVFVQNPLVKDREDIVYKTGDLGRYRHDENIEVVGRIDDQVKVNGVRAELGEIEQAILRMPGIDEVVVRLRQNANEQNELICYYTNKDISAQDLRNFLTTELDEPLMPAWFIRVPEFPLTINGKVDRKALPEPESLPGNVSYEPPQNITELMVEGIWKEVLHREQIGRNESFFLIGGNSLKAIQVISRISREFNVLIRVVEIFNNQTIAQLSRLIIKSQKNAAEEITPVPQQEHYALSHAQHRLWTLYRLDPDSYAYNIPKAFRIHGRVDIAALQRSVDLLVERHEILRTAFVLANDEPMQRIQDTAEAVVQIAFTDLTRANDAENECRIRLQEAGRLPFRLGHDNLLRIQLIRLAQQEYVLFVNMHHIITDGWSEDIFFRELLQLYRSITSGEAEQLPPLRVQYKDYAAWHNRKMQSGAMAAHRQYWLHHLETGIEWPDLPADFPRPAVRTAAGGVVVRMLDNVTSGNIQQFNAVHQCSSFVTLLAAIRVLLYRLSGKPQVVVGTPWTCRTHRDLENQIGFFVNTLPMLIPVAPDHSFMQVFQKTAATVADAEKHQEYPFDKLMEELKITRTSNRTSMFDVGFTWHPEPEPAGVTPDLSVSPYPLHFSGNKADLWFHSHPENDRLQLSLEYSGDLFRETTATLLLLKLEKLVAQAMADPQVRIADLDLQTEEEARFKKQAAGIEFNF